MYLHLYSHLCGERNIILGSINMVFVKVSVALLTVTMLVRSLNRQRSSTVKGISAKVF